MVQNDTSVADYVGKYEPWAEIYNMGGSPVNLTGYHLSVTPDYLLTWTFPNLIINPGQYIVVFFSKRHAIYPNYQIHTNFRLHFKDPGLYLSDQNGNLVDKWEHMDMDKDISAGRIPDGTGNFELFPVSTPRNSNNTIAYRSISQLPDFSAKAGFYTQSFDLTLSTTEPGGIIRYTLDGSTPSQSSPIYSGPIKIKNRNGNPNNYSNIPSAYTSWWALPGGNVEKATVVRARVFKSGYLPSVTATHTFFVDPNINSRFNMPVISLVTDSSGLFDYVHGIYVPGKIFDDYMKANPSAVPDEITPANFRQIRKRHTNPTSAIKIASMEFFEHTGVLGFVQQVGISIHGDHSRVFRQKSLNIKAGHGGIGEDWIKYPVFTNLVTKNSNGAHVNPDFKKKDMPDLVKFKKIILRNNGSDWGHSMFRDALGEAMFQHRRNTTQGYRPCVVFLNGEYWGIHDLREKFEHSYLTSHYGVLKDRDRPSILYNEGAFYDGDTSGVYDYQDLLSFIQSNDMSNSSNYEKVKERMDVESHADFYAAEIYCNNVDWPGSNIRFWRTMVQNPHGQYGHDGKWRWGLQDMDLIFGCNIGIPDCGYTHNTLLECTSSGGTTWPYYDWANILFRNILKNKDYQNLFINIMCDHINSSVKPSRVLNLIDQLQHNIQAEMPSHIQRWVSPATMADWYNEVNVLRTFAINRPQNQIAHLKAMFGLTDTVNIRLNVSDISEGFIKINTIRVDQYLPGVNDNVYPWSGMYFKNVPINLEAIPHPGYRFVRWEGTVASSNQNLTVPNSDNGQYIAVFEKDYIFNPTDNNVQLFPNPNNGNFSLQLDDENNGDIYIRVYDHFGRKVYGGSFTKTNKIATQQIQIEHPKEGVFILQIQSGSNVYKKRFSVE